MLYYERKLEKQGCDFIIGVDEAGRGPLAGPVVAAAVILRQDRFKNRIDDSKKLTASARQAAFWEIIEHSVFGIGISDEKAIDNLNILVATTRAMEQAIKTLLKKLGSLKRKKIHVIVDGNIPLDLNIPYTCIIRGDSKSKTIASASIVAKVTRDSIMSLYDRLYPYYGFIQHKGYPTKMHRGLLRLFGPSSIHRMSFRYD